VGQVQFEVFDLFCRAIGAEGELLAAEFVERGANGFGVEGELLRAFGGALDEVDLDPADFDGVIEDESDDLRAGKRRSPAGGYGSAKGLFDGEEVVFRRDLRMGVFPLVIQMLLEAGGEPGAGVEVVAECVADEVEGEDGEHDGEGGEDDHVG
jgi:hypothetical protein